MVDLFATQFYSLKPLYQECLYPRFHTILEKHQNQLVTKDPESLIGLLKAFLVKGLSDDKNYKVAYAFCDGLLNIMQTNVKEK